MPSKYTTIPETAKLPNKFELSKTSTGTVGILDEDIITVGTVFDSLNFWKKNFCFQVYDKKTCGYITKCPSYGLILKSIFDNDDGVALGSEYSSGFDLPDKVCPKCGEMMRPHHVCTSCGFYRKKEVIVKKEAKKA